MESATVRRKAASSAEASRSPWVRRAVSAVACVWLLALPALAIPFACKGLQAELRSTAGARRANVEGAVATAIEDLKAAHELAPWSPYILDRYSGLLIRQQSERAQSGQLYALDPDAANLALKLMGEAFRMHPLPDHMLLRAAETAQMWATLEARRGNAQVGAQYGAQALKFLQRYRSLRRKPLTDPQTFYRIALERSLQNNAPESGAIFWRDFKAAFPADTFNQGEVARPGIASLLISGYRAAALADTAAMLRRAPEDRGTLLFLEEAATTYKMKAEAAEVVRMLARMGKATDKQMEMVR